MQGTHGTSPWPWIPVLALVNTLLIVLLYPRGSFFIEDVLSVFLPYARAEVWPGMGNLSHFYFRLVYPLFGEVPLPYHLVTGALHLLNTILLFLLVSRLARDRAAGLMAALIMSVHPALGDTVFITKRVDTLCAVALCLTGLLLVRRWLGEGGRQRHLLLAALAALISLAWQPTAVGLWLLAPVMCLIPGRGRGTQSLPGTRSLQAVGVVASLLTVPLLVAMGLLLWSRVNRGASVGSISSVGDALACLGGSWLERLLGLGAMVQRSVVPLPLSPAWIAGTGGQLTAGQVLPATLLLFQVGLIVGLRSGVVRLALCWLLLATLPFLLQTSPCAGFALKEKYLYMILPGACLVWGLILAEGGRRLSGTLPPRLRGRALVAGLLLCLPLCAVLLHSLNEKARHRDTAGRVVQQGAELLRTGLASSPGREKLAYFFFSNEVHRYQTFTGGGDLLPQALSHLPQVPRPRHLTVEHPAYVGGETGWNLYRHLGHTPVLKPGSPGQLESLIASKSPLPPGLDSRLPPTLSRLVYVHHTHPDHGIQEISARVFPATRVRLSVRLPEGVKGPLYLGGDVAALSRAPLKVEQGLATVILPLGPGLHRLCLRGADGGGSYVLRSDDPQRFPVRGGMVLLPVASRALPLGLEEHEGSAPHRRVMALREQIMLAPRARALRVGLVQAYEEMGFHGAAQVELELIQELEEGGQR